MAKLNRPEIVELLNRLGAENDESVLSAARALHRNVSEAGLTWDDLLRPEGETGAEPRADAGVETDAEAEMPAPALADEPAEAGAEPTALAKAAKGGGTKWAEELKLIDRLLLKKDISETLRGDLTDLKRGIAAGSFDKLDAEYIRALAKRLGAN